MSIAPKDFSFQFREEGQEAGLMSTPHIVDYIEQRVIQGKFQGLKNLIYLIPPLKMGERSRFAQNLEDAKSKSNLFTDIRPFLD
jgi:hypothetical protein